MLLVGLTGNIASGKSEVARRLAHHGATLIDADVLARQVVDPGLPAYREIVERWGPDVLLPDESINRDVLRDVIFRDESARQALNAIVHPRIEARRRELIDEARQRGDRVVVCDIPLLFEAHLERLFDCVVLIEAPEQVRLERLLRVRQLDEVEAHRMMAAQMSSEEKRGKADYVIENDGSFLELERKADRLWQLLEARPDARVQRPAESRGSGPGE